MYAVVISKTCKQIQMCVIVRLPLNKLLISGAVKNTQLSVSSGLQEGSAKQNVWGTNIKQGWNNHEYSKR